MSLKPALFVAAAVVAAALLLGVSGRSAGQPKGAAGADERAGQLEKKLEQPTPSRWQMQTVPFETVGGNPPVRYTAGHILYLLDTQTGTLVRFSSNDPKHEPVQMFPKK